ncbi:MAG: tryptophan--tRNA ligase [Candidatus Dojkabacteria bacterium]|nr:tryptophan--tRNA ligase [Candidatus Dojkabacteria bacterium]
MKKQLLEQTKKEFAEKEKILKQVENNLKSKIDGKSLKSFERIRKYMKGKSRYIDRGIVNAHLDFEPITSLIAKKQKFFIISGKNPSTSLHLGHYALFKFLLELQRLGAKIIIPLTNDESYVDGKVNSLNEGKKIASENIAKDIVAMGFDPRQTSIFVHSDFLELYRLSIYYGNFINNSQVNQIFGDRSANTPSKMFYRGAVQMTSILMPQLKEFGGPQNVLVPVAVDQHPYVLLTRDVAKKCKLVPPSEIVIEFLLNLENPAEKMSSSRPDSAIFLDDSEKDIERKIMKAYTGSVSSLEGHRRLGAIPEICPVFQTLRFHHGDTAYVEETYQKYKSGKLLATELKRIVVEFVLKMLKEQRRKRKKVDCNMIEKFILKKKIE